MKQLLLFLLLSLAAPCIMAFDYPLGNGDNPSIVFNGASGGGHLADALPEGYYSFVTQALHITFHDCETEHYVTVYDGSTYYAYDFAYGTTACVPCTITQAGIYTVTVAPDDESPVTYIGTLTITSSDLPGYY